MHLQAYANAAALGLALLAAPLAAADAPPDFQRDVHPLLQRYCFECHDMDEQEGDLDLQSIAGEADYRTRHVLLEDMLFMVDEGDMPPKKAEHHPSGAERAVLTAWLQATLLELQNAQPDDPGVVVMPRINHREYDYVVRDLTGLELDVGRYLTPDSAAGEGFLNVGEAHTTTVGQFEAFLATAKKVVGHARITHRVGPVWSAAPQPEMATPELQRKALAQAVLDWFELERNRQLYRHLKALREQRKMVLGAYLEAAWRYRHRAALGQDEADLAAIADASEVPLYPGALEKVWYILTGEGPDFGGEGRKLRENLFIARLIEAWEALPPPAAAGSGVAEDCRRLEALADIDTGRWRFHRPGIELPPADRSGKQQEWGLTEDAQQPYVIDLSKASDGTIHLIVGDGGDGGEGDRVRWHRGTVDGRPWQEVFTAPTAVVGAAASFQGDVLEVQAPSVLRLAVPAGAKRLELTLGFAPGADPSVMGLIDDEPREELGWIHGRRLLGTGVGKRAKRLNQQADAVGILTTDNDGYTKIRDRNAYVDLPEDLRRAYGLGEQEDPRRPNILFALSPLDVQRRADPADLAELERIKSQMADAVVEDPAARERAARELLTDWSGRAWRRMPSDAEVDALMAFYREELAAGASYDAAVKVPMVAILVSPHFLFRSTESERNDEPYPLAAHELATRLAFTLWASLPDEELRGLAATGSLTDEATLRAQVARMLEDPRAVGFIREFAGQWLQVGDFAESAAPDPERFEDFDDELKRAMAAEFERYMLDLFQHDRPLTNVIASDYTFLNQRLAKHYGIAGVEGKELRRVTVGGHRGGVLTMGAPLVKYSTPLRTSPVKRGAWVFEYVMGLHLPEPPATVPQISDDERDQQGRSVREQLEQHRNDPSCLGCHDKIDPLGIALEGFDPVGRWRDADLAGEPVDDQGAFLEEERTLDGLTGLRGYLEEHRDQFVRNFCVRLLGYALGRVVQPTDAGLIDRMVAAVAADDYRPRAAIELVVTSRQFTHRRDEIEQLGME